MVWLFYTVGKLFKKNLGEKKEQSKQKGFPWGEGLFSCLGGYLVVPLAILEELTEELGFGLLVFGELLNGEDLLETLDVFLL